MRSLHSKGFTLAELMVYSVVLGVFVTALYATFSLGLSTFHRTQGKSDVVQSAEAAANFLERTVATGAGSTLTVPNPQVCFFLSAQPPGVVFRNDPVSGAPVWQQWLCFFLDASAQRLMMSELAITPSSTIPAAPSLNTLLARPARVVASNVATVSFTKSGGLLSYQISAQVTPSLANAQPLGLTLTGHFAMRN